MKPRSHYSLNSHRSQWNSRFSTYKLDFVVKYKSDQGFLTVGRVLKLVAQPNVHWYLYVVLDGGGGGAWAPKAPHCTCPWGRRDGGCIVPLDLPLLWHLVDIGCTNKQCTSYLLPFHTHEGINPKNDHSFVIIIEEFTSCLINALCMVLVLKGQDQSNP